MHELPRGSQVPTGGTSTVHHDRGPDDAVVCAGLTKDYGQGRGLFDLDLTIRRGEVFGFVGPNGAGKTTTARLLMDLIRPDRGTATILGLDSRRDSLAIKRQVGFLPGELPQFPGVSAGYVIGLLAGLRGGVDPARVSALAERLQLDLGARYERLSDGNKQKVHLIQAFMHDPALLVLDEPTLGLDPLMQREFRGPVGEAAAGGSTVLLSSHLLGEVELICDRIGMLREGRLLRVGSIEELRTVRVHRVEAVVRDERDVGELARIPGVTDAEINGELVTCAVRGSVGPPVVGVVVVTTAALAGLLVAGTAVGGTLDVAGLGRVGVECVLLGAALGAVAAVLVAWLRRGAAMRVLSVVVGASYLVGYFVPLFDWPDWLNRLSVFWAFGQPYLGWPAASGLTTMLVLAVPGGLLAAAIAERTPKVA